MITKSTKSISKPFQLSVLNLNAETFSTDNFKTKGYK